MDQTNARGGWWIRLTAPPGTANYDQAPTYQERDRLRRAGLTSIVAPAVFIAPVLLVQQISDPGTMGAIISLMIVSLFALFLNRVGRQQFAALLLIFSMEAIIEGTIATAQGGLGSGWLLTFDLFAVPLVGAGVLLNRRYIWFFVLLHIACILGDFYLLPHTKDLNDLITLWHGPSIAFARPIILQILLGPLTFLALRSMDQAIDRANRAEEVAALEREIANSKQQLERDAQTLREALAQIASGNFKVRAQVPQGTVLWDIARSINNMLQRLERYGLSEHELNRTKQEAQVLASALDDLAAGRRPLWPGRAGTLLDPIIDRLSSMSGFGRPAQPPRR
ncbi:hypothetical protein KSC_024150 [Ktedonobacter sp. SOSP1-52]|uniref:HAMP domain-containing protein n=1 Tax=Ktedonobacter sp. SOSP1-52 TaxID=2778366 RepID=UPI001915A763|nr:hypothetical protein [Ktedonobacter sp. SOSP1-52]GHO63523.1 hypothetical protein KSC_024150 [Ktedonobacter sp. SOSP1-52]